MMGSYCEGMFCSKRNQCALHRVSLGTYEYIDWSTYGGGQAWTDAEGNTHIETWADCGDEGKFKKFITIDRSTYK